MKDKKMVIIILIILLLIVIASSFVYIRLNEVKETDSLTNSIRLNFDYKEKFAGFSIDKDGIELDNIPNSGKYTLAIYISDQCQSCIEVLKNINRITDIFGILEIEYMFLWEDDIPVNLIEKYNVKNVTNYSLKGKTRLASSTPTIFILDKEQQVVFANENISLIVEKMIDLNIVPNTELKANADRYIKEEIIKSTSDKQQMIYFYMEGCSDCAKANEVLDSEVEAKYEITKIYKYNDTDESRVRDTYKIFANIYGVKWYPSFLLFQDNDSILIGETPIEKLKSTLLEN